MITGFLYKKKAKKLRISGPNWKYHFFVLKRTGHLFYYSGHSVCLLAIVARAGMETDLTPRALFQSTTALGSMDINGFYISNEGTEDDKFTWEIHGRHSHTPRSSHLHVADSRDR
jgi:hypothetical protein